MDKRTLPPSYFEGILQLRDHPLEVEEYIVNSVKKEKGVFISKAKKQKKGVDLYLSSNKFLQSIAKKLRGRYPGEIIVSKRLFTRNRQTQKEVFRGCVLFRYHKVQKGQRINIKGEEYVILGASKKIHLQNIETQKKRQIDFKDL